MKAAEAAGLPYDIRRISFHPGHLGRKPTVRASLAGVDEAASDRLCAPWPEVVLVIGRHLSCIALWIKQQSGGATRIALFNAPKGRAADFDLVVLPPYYRGQHRPNVLAIRTPLIGIDPRRIAEAGEALAPSVSGMRRPLHVLLVGGDMGQRKLKPSFAADVYRRMCSGFAAEGSVHVSTSPRTPAAVADMLRRNLRPQDRLHVWRRGDAASPYLGLLALGETFTVTADSLSMLIEVARLARPLVIAEPPRDAGLAGLADSLTGLFRPRDLRRAVNMLYAEGYAVPLGVSPKPSRGWLPDDSGLVAERLRMLAGAESGLLAYRYPATSIAVEPVTP